MLLVVPWYSPIASTVAHLSLMCGNHGVQVCPNLIFLTQVFKQRFLIVHVDYSNLWRTCEDINATWVSILTNLDSLVGNGKYGGPDHWNNPGKSHFSI